MIKEFTYTQADLDSQDDLLFNDNPSIKELVNTLGMILQDKACLGMILQDKACLGTILQDQACPGTVLQNEIVSHHNNISNRFVLTEGSEPLENPITEPTFTL